MEQIIVGFSKPKTKFKPLSSIIRWFDGSDFSHVYIKFYSSKYDRWLIYQASGIQVHFVEKSRFESKVEIIDEIILDISDETYRTVIQKCIDLAGAGYGVGQLFGYVIAKVLKLNKNPFNRGYVCSELVAELLQEICPDIIKTDINLLTPMDIYKLLISHKAKTCDLTTI